MITCPWCGTSYQAFQPNCDRCGGPIHETHDTIETAPGETIPVPPPPPRSISDSYAWKLMASDGWSITAMIFGLIGGIFFIVGVPLTIAVITAFVGLPFALLGLAFLAGGIGVLFWRYRETHKVIDCLRVGQPVRGEILEAEENFNVSVNNRHPWNITYEFILNNQIYDSKLSTLNANARQLQKGQAVCVLYLPDNPAVNTIFPRP